jgi:hypothetical protein
MTDPTRFTAWQCHLHVPTSGDPFVIPWEDTGEAPPIPQPLLRALANAAAMPGLYASIASIKPADLLVQYFGEPVTSTKSSLVHALENSAHNQGAATETRDDDFTIIAEWRPNKNRTLDKPPENVPERKGNKGPRARMEGEFDHSLSRFEQLIERELESLPSDYQLRRQRLIQYFGVVRTLLGRALEPMLNAQAASMPHETYEDKKRLAKWVNAELQQIGGLALRCPRTKKPCFLMGNPGGTPGRGRFVFEYTDEQGKRHHPFTSVSLPRLVLMPDDLVRASYKFSATAAR